MKTHFFQQKSSSQQQLVKARKKKRRFIFLLLSFVFSDVHVPSTLPSPPSHLSPHTPDPWPLVAAARALGSRPIYGELRAMR